jgi:hypothetical protein
VAVRGVAMHEVQDARQPHSRGTKLLYYCRNICKRPAGSVLAPRTGVMSEMAILQHWCIIARRA